MMRRTPAFFRIAAAAFALSGWLAAVPGAAAQQLPYGDVSGGAGLSGTASAPDDGNGDTDTGASDSGGARPPRHRGKARIAPYIEAKQVALAELSPGSDVLTYSTLAAGVDASIAGRNNAGSVSLRYERRIGWGRKTSDSDVLSGVARVSAALVPHALTLEAGALASRLGVENTGSTVNGSDFRSSSTQVYAVYGGPSLATQSGDVALDAHYRIGYTRVDSPHNVQLAPGQTSLDVFDHSLAQDAQVHAGTHPDTLLPVGLGLGAGWRREDVSNLDQRVDDKHLRGDVTVPVSSDLALVGGLGYEDVTVSSRDALRDPATGLPVIGSDGRYVTDPSAPRRIAFHSDGLIWDAGVLWRPSRRTSLEAHFGRRYGSTTYYGSFAYAPSDRTRLNVSVYDNYSGLGAMVNTALANLPTRFQTLRNPLSGDLAGCVEPQDTAAPAQGTCLTGALGSVRSSVFRSRGIMATYGVTGRRVQYGIAAGYDHRSFVGAPGTVLALADGVIDRSYWVSAYLNGRIDRRSGFGTGVWANWYESGDAVSGNVFAIGATAVYYRSLTDRLTASAAVGTQNIDRELLADIWSAQALAGVRYSF